MMLSTRGPVRATRFFSTSIAGCKNALPPRPRLPDSELHHVYLKGSGPGGQKIVRQTASLKQLASP